HEEALLLPDAASPGVTGEARADFVFDDASAPTELTEAIEVTEEGHVGISGVFPVPRTSLKLVGLLRCAEEGQIRPQKHNLGAPSLSGDPQIKPWIAAFR